MLISFLLQFCTNLKCVNNGKNMKVIHKGNEERITEQWFRDAL